MSTNGTALRKLRMEARMSQNELSRDAGVSRDTISLAENDKTNLQELSRNKIAGALGDKLGRTVDPDLLGD